MHYMFAQRYRKLTNVWISQWYKMKSVHRTMARECLAWQHSLLGCLIGLDKQYCSTAGVGPLSSLGDHSTSAANGTCRSAQLAKSFMQVTECHLHECLYALYWVHGQGTHPGNIPDWVWSPSRLFSHKRPLKVVLQKTVKLHLNTTTSRSMAKMLSCNAGKSAQKWALSCHCLIKSFFKLKFNPLFALVPYDNSLQIDEYWHWYFNY